MNYCPFKIELLNQAEIATVSTFVVTQNLLHHASRQSTIGSNLLHKSVYTEDNLYFNNSKYYVARNQSDDIVGSIRVMRWDGVQQLPFEKEYNLKISDFTDSTNASFVWHIGRFAIRSGIRSIILLKKLMVIAIAPIVEKENTISFAECDVKLLHALKMMKIDFERISEEKEYIGSSTVAILLSTPSLLAFYENNVHLLHAIESLMLCRPWKTNAYAESNKHEISENTAVNF